ncbi:ATP-dependent Clp protease ATP-binding subunit [bacterium]|nr:ATP-dependent Clp protease ATP-binding subunit [bacterium]
MQTDSNQFERFTDNAKRSLQNAGAFAQSMGASYVGTEHLLLGVLKQEGSIGARVLNEMGVTLDKLNIQVSSDAGLMSPSQLSETAKKTVTLALRVAQEFGQPFAGTEHILFALLSQKNARANVMLRELKVNPTSVRNELENYLSSQNYGYTDEANTRKGKQSKTPALDHFAVDMTEKARQNELDPVVGRESQIERMVSILNRRTKNNPVLIGEPGVGKTAIVEGLAQRIVNEDVPDMLVGKKLLMLDLAGVIAGTKYRGEFEERLKKLIEEAKANKDVILFIDELHTVVGAGSAEGAIDAANILKPALSRGEVQTIGATTLDEYRKYIEKDSALERRFQPVIVPEATVEETIEVLKGLRPRYQDFHQVTISDEAIEGAAKLAKRYISDRFMPDKAIDLVDEAASLARIKRGGTSKRVKNLQTKLNDIMSQIDDAVYNQDFEYAARLKSEASILEQKLTEQSKKERQAGKIMIDGEDIAAVVAQATGVPITKLIKVESETLIKLEQTLKSHVIGQDEAVEVVARSIRRSRTGIADVNRPIGSFIFLGPTGVGKTELARVLAKEIFHDKDAMIKVDMSEFMEKHNVSRLVGAPAGYVGFEEGGQLTEQVRRKPYSLILFDEIEKAHPDVFNMLLQILEDGMLTDAKGRKVDFRNTIIIMTSNVGAKVLRSEAELGFKTETADEQKKLEQLHERMKKTIQDEMKKVFKPEFLNRIDHIVVFRALSQVDIRKIVNLQLANLASRLQEKAIVLRFTTKLKNLLVSKGYDAEQGARPMRRAIQSLVEDKLATQILDGSIVASSEVVVSASGEEVTTKVLGQEPQKTATK